MTGKPAILADAKLWLDASNVDGYNNISLSDGDAVSTWTDLSGMEMMQHQRGPQINRLTKVTKFILMDQMII